MGTREIAIVGGRQQGKTLAMQRMTDSARAPIVVIDECGPYPEAIRQALVCDGDTFKKEYLGTFDVDPEPPRRLSIELHSPDYHPSYLRVGVRVDGEERNDLAFYDVDQLSYMTTKKTSHLAKSIEPYWRFSESRQQRRARERWEAKRK